MRAMFVGFAGALVLLATLTCASASPGEPDVGARVSNLGRSLMSPFCPGRTLQSCPSPEAARWLDDIHAWAAQGRSDDEIVQLLRARVPEFDLDGQPPAATGWFLGLVPVGATSLLLIVAAWRVSARRRRRVPEAGPPEDVDRALDEALDEELAHID
jgi:cytochrome c-type biogenesis protein CcmH/NrfF